MKEKQLSGFGFVFVLLVFVSKSICVNVYGGEAEIWPWFCIFICSGLCL